MSGWGIEQFLLYGVLALATLIALLAGRRTFKTWRRAREADRRMAAGSTPSAGGVSLQGVTLFPLQIPAAPPSYPLASPVAADPVAIQAAVAAPAADARGARPAARARRTGFDPGLPAAELLALAEARLSTGEREEAAEYLRTCIRVAQKSKQSLIEARARVALGDIAKTGGDLTSACEHWQLARVLFSGLDEQGDVRATVDRMERAGCPTDWVLTEF